jgi:hypothetical protein
VKSKQQAGQELQGRACASCAVHAYRGGRSVVYLSAAVFCARVTPLKAEQIAQQNSAGSCRKKLVETPEGSQKGVQVRKNVHVSS